MNIVTNFLKWLSITTGAAFALWGNLPDAVRLLVVLMILDMTAGIAYAIYKRELSPRVAWDGVSKKVMTLVLVGLAYLITDSITLPNLGVHAGTAAAGFYVAAESISILEKANKIGIPIPAFLRDGLSRLEEPKG